MESLNTKIKSLETKVDLLHLENLSEKPRSPTGHVGKHLIYAFTTYANLAGNWGKRALLLILRKKIDLKRPKRRPITRWEIKLPYRG